MDPYKHQSDNVIQSVVVIQLFLTVVLGLTVFVQTHDDSLLVQNQDQTLDVCCTSGSRRMQIDAHDHAVAAIRLSVGALLQPML